MPLVSVIVPNYNHARYLPRRLDSILQQTFRDWELIILDDASTDDSRAVISQYLSDPRIRFLPNETNSGSTFVQWNRGVAAARGDFIWIAESDDYADPRFLDELVPLLSVQPNIGLAYCQSWWTDSDGHVSGTLLKDWDQTLGPSRWERAFINRGSDECAGYLLWNCTVPNASAALLRREVYRRVGGAPTDMRLCGDWLTWARLMAVSDVAFTPKCLNYFRHHATTVRATTKWSQHLRERWRVQSFILRSCAVSAASRRRLARLTLGDVFNEVLPAPPGKKLSTLRSCLASCTPILIRCPLTVSSVCLGRAARSFAKRLRTALHPPFWR